MENKKRVLAVFIAFVALLTAASVVYAVLSQKNISEEDLVDPNLLGTLAPDFTVYDIDGNAVKLSDYKGKPVVVNFWASWCGPCKSEMPDFDEKYIEYGEDVKFMMVNMTDGFRETTKSASKFITGNEYQFPVFYDTESSADTAYGVQSLPTTFFIDAEGYILTRAIGAIDAERLQRGINMIME